MTDNAYYLDCGDVFSGINMSKLIKSYPLNILSWKCVHHTSTKLRNSGNNSAQLLSISWFYVRYPSYLLHTSISYHLWKVFVFMFILSVDCEFLEDVQFIVIPPGSRSLVFKNVLEFKTNRDLMCIEYSLRCRHHSTCFYIWFNSHSLPCSRLDHPNLPGTETWWI